MIKTILRLIFISFILASCSKRFNPFQNHMTENNIQNFYIVDTIKIVNPIKIQSIKFGGQFIISKDILNYYNGKKDFYYRPDVYLLGNDLYKDMDSQDWEKYYYPGDENCNIVKSQLATQGLEIYEYNKDSTLFILALINANHYYIKNNSYESFNFELEKIYHTFLKIVYPLCK